MFTTFDGGRTWRTSFVTDELINALVVADSEAWLAGSCGLLARTTDGLSWQIVSVPAEAHCTAIWAKGGTTIVAGADGLLGVWDGMARVNT